MPADIRPCCGRVNRGLAILGDKVFMGTMDSHVIALDAKTGNVVWDVNAFDYTKGYSITLAPLAIESRAHRCQWRRVRNSRIHRCLRREHRRTEMALLYGSRAGRARPRKLGRRLLENWRGARMDYRIV